MAPSAASEAEPAASEVEPEGAGTEQAPAKPQRDGAPDASSTDAPSAPEARPRDAAPETSPADAPPAPAEPAEPAPAAHDRRPILVLGALGVVFGDIGTSPLYALHTVFSADDQAIRLTQAAVYGVISMVFWSLVLVVSVKYVTFVMRADNDGEGGIMALIALVQRIRQKGGFAPKTALVTVGVVGAALFFGDAMITPAISVMSAVEGLEVVSPGLESVVVPASLTVLVVLFAGQRFGTGAVGRLFGPICALWFMALAIGGGAQIAEHPGVLASLSPTYAVSFAVEHFGLFFLALGGIVLAITGVEALYADMGHFGRRAITLAWFCVVFPALTLNYMGQGALLLRSEGAISNPFFLLYADWLLIPMVVLATAATVIASQAVISGAFSVTRQAVQLGFLPRMRIRHTSRREAGQVYVPSINWAILAAVVGLVLGFGSSAKLAAAYGIAVTGTLAIDTILFVTVARLRFRRPLWLVALGGALFLALDLLFFSANASKVLAGGWFPIAIALGVFCVFMTWHKGRALVTAARTAEEGPLRDFVEEVREMSPPLHRPAETAIFLHASRETTPLALRANVEYNRTLHASVVIVSVDVGLVPSVPEEERVSVDDLGYTDDGIVHLSVRYGYLDETDIPAAIAVAARRGLECPVDLDRATYFLSHIDLRRGPQRHMARWRKSLFIAMSHNAANPAEYFRLPLDRIVVMGGHITV